MKQPNLKTFTLIYEGLKRSIILVTYYETNEKEFMIVDNETLQQWNDLGYV